MSLVVPGAEERARVLAGMFRQCPDTGGFRLYWEVRQVGGKFESSDLRNDEIVLEFRTEDGTLHRSTWRHNGLYTSNLLSCVVECKFSGDPGGTTTPIGMPERLELPDGEIKRLNNGIFFMES